MNGAHDMGGMHGLGVIEREADEPVFHTRWEARSLAISLAMGAWRRWNIDASRHARELIPGPEYLQMSYYEKWNAGLERLLVSSGLVTAEELASGQPAAGAAVQKPPLVAAAVGAMLAKGSPSARDVEAKPKFDVGQCVRARNINPVGHTRLPRYARGRIGIIDRDHGVHVFPDSNAHFKGEQPQHLYSVRFDATDLWGEQANTHDGVYIDLWEAHLEAV